MSKECRIVNGGGDGVVGGFVNNCEQVLDDQNEMVMAASKTAKVSGSDRTLASINHRICPLSSNDLDKLKDFSIENHMSIEENTKSITLKSEELLQLTKEVDIIKQKLALHNQYIPKIAAREKNLDVLPIIPVSSTCSSGMKDLTSTGLQDQQEQQGIKPKRRRICQAATEQPNPDPLKPNQTKQSRTRITRPKSAKIRKMQELFLVTADDAYYTCLGNYDSIKDEPVSKNINSNLEIPRWRVKTYSSLYSMEGTENMSDNIFENRHYRLEKIEQKCKRWDLQRVRELKRVEYLKEGRNKQHSKKSNNKKQLTTLLPSPSKIKAIEITDKLLMSAFGINLYIKKKHEIQWCNNGSQAPKGCNIRGLRSSGCSAFYDTV
ncbi:male-specific lethal 1-like 1 [Acyrthosiphon pisum]|uniref:PEHE domain-containing protein n=1 Tax=Acyrthosiphon pisum TaxID=7029 RepID=A0A8R2NQI5_ACYPI|nr:male-specific lethal 1-like 1 [Acyrthosiphon pisum]